MSYFSNDITDQYLTKIYDDMQREQTRLMNDLKTGSKEAKEEKDITKQITMVNSITLSVLKLKNFRKKINGDNF